MKSVSIASAIVSLGLVSVLALAAVLDRQSGVLTWRELSGERTALREKIAVQRRANTALASRIEALLNDPYEADRAIRDELRASG